MSDIWIDDGFAEAEPRIDTADRGLLLGDGVFDTALALGGHVFRRNEHVERLMNALEALEIPLGRHRVESAMDALAAHQKDGSIRITVTRGPGPRGLAFPPEPRPLLLGTSAPFSPAVVFAPLRLAVTEVRRNETSITSRLKTLSYLDAILANRGAREAGADEALFLNTRGNIACSALGNVFLLKGSTLTTPPVEDGVLPGIMRGWILGHAATFGLKAREASLDGTDLNTADALFVTNSLRLIAPATLGDEKPATVNTEMARLMRGLCKAISEECRRDLSASIPAIAP